MLVNRKEMNLSTWDEANIWNTYAFRPLGRKQEEERTKKSVGDPSIVFHLDPLSRSIKKNLEVP